MATRTEFLKLIKPDYNDAADIADINANMDTIDAKTKELNESGGKALMAHDQSQAAHAAMAATINALMGPTTDTDTVRNLLNYLANRYKTASGTSDWKDNPSINLKDIKDFIDKLASGSAVQWNGKKWKNPLTGESGLMDQNGYYCGGPNRANFIIQWGFINGVKTSSIHSGTLSYPIVYPNRAFSVFIGANGVSDLLAAEVQDNSSFNWRAGNKILNLYAYWISFGK